MEYRVSGWPPIECDSELVGRWRYAKVLWGTKLWPGKIDRVSFNDGTDAKPSFIFKCDDKNYPDGYPIEYCDVKKYADKEDPKFSQFTLPEEPPCIYVDIELKALCDQTLQELNSKSLPVFFFASTFNQDIGGWDGMLALLLQWSICLLTSSCTDYTLFLQNIHFQVQGM